MNLAYIITAYKSPEQVIRLVSKLNTEGTQFFVHVDKKTDGAVYHPMVGGFSHCSNVFILKRFKCNHAGFGIVEAFINGIEKIYEVGEPFDYLINLTGNCYPVKSNQEIKARLQRGYGYSYLEHCEPFRYDNPAPWLRRFENWHVRTLNRSIRFPLKVSNHLQLFSIKHSPVWLSLNLLFPKKRKFPKGFQPYFGSGAWCIAKEHVDYLYAFIKSQRAFVKYFKHVFAPDELMFQTILANSPFKNKLVNNDLRYTDWSKGGLHPKILCWDDWDKLCNTEDLFARKFDATVDAGILDLLDVKLLSEEICTVNCTSVPTR